MNTEKIREGKETHLLSKQIKKRRKKVERRRNIIYIIFTK